MPSSYQLVNDILPSAEALYSGRYNYDDMPDPQSLSMGSAIIVDNHDGNISLYVDDGNNWINVATAMSSPTEIFGYRSDSFYGWRMTDENVDLNKQFVDFSSEHFHDIIKQVMVEKGL